MIKKSEVTAEEQMLDAASFAMYMVDKTYQKTVDLDGLIKSVKDLITAMELCNTNEVNIAAVHQVLAACYEYKIVNETPIDGVHECMKEWVIKKLRNACSCAAMNAGYTMFVSELHSPMHAIFIESRKINGNEIIF